jgi:uncharacterized membrane protein YhiD involved in acid resistance
VEIIRDLQQLSTMALTPGQAIRNLGMALTCGLLVAGFYRLAIQHRAGYRTFAGALIAMAMITAVVIMVIENNLARAFGLVGAMSIIRFRTAVKDIQDIVFIFFALAMGMSCGVGMYAVSLIGSLAVGTILVTVARVQPVGGRRREYLLQFTYWPKDAAEPPYLALLRRYCRKDHLVNSRARPDGESLDLAFYVVLKDMDEHSQLVRELADMDSVHNVNLFFDEEDF